ncbi:ROK family glucokinase [Actinomycetota bacterium]
MTLTIGIDIGGTKLAGGLVDEHGTILKEGRRDTPAQDPAAIATEAADIVRELAEGAPGEIVGVGLACAGFINAEGTHILFAPNLAWRNEPMQERLSSLVDYPVVIENDANAAAWGEFRHGAASDADDMLLVTIGTGVGGGIVSDGKLLRGAYGIGGEIGHMRLVPGGHRCGCGNRGCFEVYGSGSALVREARELIASGTPLAAGLSERCGGDPDKLKGRDITAAAEADDPAAKELLTDLGTWIGEGVASLGAVLDPGRIVIGGGVVEAGDLLMQPVRAAYGRNLIGRGYRPMPEIVAASLGNKAGLIGAAALAADGGGR